MICCICGVIFRIGIVRNVDGFGIRDCDRQTHCHGTPVAICTKDGTVGIIFVFSESRYKYNVLY